MATLTLDPAAGADTPFAGDLKAQNVKTVRFTGQSAADATTVAAAPGAGLKHVILSMECSSDAGGETLQLKSATTVKRTIPFPVAALAAVDRRIELDENEALVLQKSGTSATFHGEIRWITLRSGGDVPR